MDNATSKPGPLVYFVWTLVSLVDGLWFTLWMFVMWAVGGYSVVWLNLIFALSVAGCIVLLVRLVRTESRSSLLAAATLVSSMVYPSISTFFLVATRSQAIRESRTPRPIDLSAWLVFLIFGIQIPLCFSKLYQLRTTE